MLEFELPRNAFIAEVMAVKLLKERKGEEEGARDI